MPSAQKKTKNSEESDVKNFLEAVSLSAQYLANEALSHGCFKVYHICKVLEQTTQEDQSYIPYSCEDTVAVRN